MVEEMLQMNGFKGPKLTCSAVFVQLRLLFDPFLNGLDVTLDSVS